MSAFRCDKCGKEVYGPGHDLAHCLLNRLTDLREALTEIANYTGETRPTGEQHWIHLRSIARRALAKVQP